MLNLCNLGSIFVYRWPTMYKACIKCYILNDGKDSFLLYDSTLIRNNPPLKNPLALKLELTFSMANSSRGKKLVVETNQSLSFPEHDILIC